jgi:hypothetical protein
MRYSGILERLTARAESYQQKWLRLQELQKELISYLIYIDLDAVDSVALGKGGMNMTPQEIIDFMFEKQVVLFRSSGGVTQNPNYKPGWIEGTAQGQAIVQLYNGMVNDIQMLYQLSD